MCIDVIISSSYTDLYRQLLFQRMRRQGLPADAYWADHSIYEATQAMVMEVTAPSDIPKFWSLYTQLAAISWTKLFVFSDTPAEQWTTMMNQVLQEDTTATAFKLKWKASRNGGRTIAVPSATAAALAASRRQGNANASSADLLADIIVQGEVGKEDGEVLRLLMTHLCQVTGLHLTETDYRRAPHTGEYIHLASQDLAVPPGRLRVLLPDLEAVRKVRAALHGQTLQVGQDRIGIEVTNDYFDSASVPGNGQRRQR